MISVLKLPPRLIGIIELTSQNISGLTCFNSFLINAKYAYTPALLYTGFPHSITLIPLASNLLIYSLSLTSVNRIHSNSSYVMSCSKKSLRYMPTPLGLLPKVLASTAIFNFFITVFSAPNK